MARVSCQIEEIELEGDYETSDGGYVSVPSVCATCSKCGHTVESYGTEEASVKRCLALMNEECPEGENNFYVVGNP